MTVGDAPNGATPSLIPWVTIAIGFLFLMSRVAYRVRPQRARSGVAIVLAVMVVLSALASLLFLGTITDITSRLILSPLAIAAGVALGIWGMRWVKFNRDPNTGELWMRGGGLYIAVWSGSVLLRYAASALVPMPVYTYGSYEDVSGQTPLGLLFQNPLLILSTELVFFSAGMWAARAYAIWKRERQPEAHQSWGT